MVYAVVSDVQQHILLGTVTIGVASEPSSATVTAWLADISAWIDAVLSWRYGVPVTDADDVLLLRPIAAMLAAARVFRVRSTASSSVREIFVTEADRLTALALATLVYFPAGTGSLLPGAAVTVASRDAARFGRSYLVLPNTAEVSGTAASDHETPVSSFDAEPGEGEEPERLFSRDMDL